MRNLVIFAALAVSAVGCVQDQQAILLGRHIVADEECEPDFNLYQTRGRTNVAASGGRYLGTFAVTSTLVADSSETGSPNDNPTIRDFIGTELITDYELYDNGVRTPLGVSTQRQPIHLVVPAGATNTTFFVALDLIAPGALSTVSALPPGSVVLVSAQVTGSFRSGVAGSSNTVEFPVEVVNVAPACPPGLTLVENVVGVCGTIGVNSLGFACE